MTNTARVVGVNAYMSFAGTAINGDYRNFDIEQTVDTVEKSAGSETSKSYIPTLKDGTGKLVYAYTGGTATAMYVNNFVVGTQGTLLWGVEGTATGKPKGGVYAIVTAHSKPMTYNDLVLRTVSFQFTGDVLFDDENDTW